MYIQMLYGISLDCVYGICIDVTLIFLMVFVNLRLKNNVKDGYLDLITKEAGSGKASEHGAALIALGIQKGLSRPHVIRRVVAVLDDPGLMFCARSREG